MCHPLLDDKNHFIYSMALCKKLKGFGTHSVGTLRANRKDYPGALKNKALLKKLKRGIYHIVSGEEITITVWKDTKEVSFISNVHSSRGQDTVSRKKKDCSVSQIPALPVVKDYNANMGAMRKNDQLKKSYAIDRKSKRWWICSFLH